MAVKCSDLEDLLDDARGPKSEAPPPSSLERSLVLVVDDDLDVRKSLEHLFSARYRVVTCASAMEGVQSFNDEVCAVVLDVKMKRRDGFWACNEIRKQAPTIPVIFYSAYQDAMDPFEIINKHRPFAYIQKDGNTKRLLEAVETATRLYRTTIRSQRILNQLRKRRVEQA